MQGSKVFAKLDMREDYTPIELEKESRKITNFNTEDGIYLHKRFAYEISFNEIISMKYFSE